MLNTSSQALWHTNTWAWALYNEQKADRYREEMVKVSRTIMDVALRCETLEMTEWIFLEWALSSTGNDIGWKTIVILELSLQLWRSSHNEKNWWKNKSLIRATQTVRSIVHRNNIILQSKTWIIYNPIPIQILYYFKNIYILPTNSVFYFLFYFSPSCCPDVNVVTNFYIRTNYFFNLFILVFWYNGFECYSDPYLDECGIMYYNNYRIISYFFRCKTFLNMGLKSNLNLEIYFKWVNNMM